MVSLFALEGARRSPITTLQARNARRGRHQQDPEIPWIEPSFPGRPSEHGVWVGSVNIEILQCNITFMYGN